MSIETLLTENRIWMGRTKGIGYISAGRCAGAEHDRADYPRGGDPLR